MERLQDIPMKNGSTMYDLAKARAISDGPRATENQRIIGYYLTVEELKKMFAREGFVVSVNGKRKTREVWQDIIERWIFADRAMKVGNYVFILLDNTDFDDVALRTKLIEASERAQISEVIA